MKALYFILGALIGGIIAFSYSCMKLDRPTCFEDQFLIRDFSNEYVCINKDDIKPIEAFNE